MLEQADIANIAIAMLVVFALGAILLSLLKRQ
jgi:hypothetical protein